MADATNTAQPGGFDLLKFLTDRIGLSGALQLLTILNPQASPVQKGFGAAKLATPIAQGLGFNPMIPGTETPALPAALAAAGFGYQLSQIAGDPNLSDAQKVGHSGHAAFDLYGNAYIPYYGAVKAINAVGQHLEGSGSPQIRGTGRSLDYVTEPAGAKGFWDVVQGDRSPSAAFKAQGGTEGLMLDTMGPIGIILRGLGVHLPFLSHTPTTGTEVRGEVSRVADQIPALKGFQMGQDVLNADQYNQYSPDAQKNAYALADLLGSYAPDYKKNQPAYQVQLGNSLLKQYGDAIPGIVKSIFNPGTPDASTAPTVAPSPTAMSDPTSMAFLQSQTMRDRIANYLAGQAR